MDIDKIKQISPKIWGIVNITPDSFSDGGLFLNPEKAYSHIEKLLNEGADFIDIGSASSRPSSDFITAEEEWNRLEPLFNLIAEKDKHLFSKISVDTWSSYVAQKALERNVFCINDISACRWDTGLLDVLVEYKPYYVLMYSEGQPKTMQEKINIKDNEIIDKTYSFFEKQLEKLDKVGFPKEKIMLDVGIGFGKTLEQNILLLNAEETFLRFGIPLYSGVSRKTWLRNLFSLTTQEQESKEKGKYSFLKKGENAQLMIEDLDRLTANASLLLLQKGYLHHRVHNVKYTRQAFDLYSILM